MRFVIANTEIATIDKNGVVTAKKAGITTATVTAYKSDGSTSAALTTTCNVTVTPKAPTIEFSLGTGITATITTSEADAKIYYTTNGDTPMTSSTQYTGPFTVEAGATVKAIVVVTVNGEQLVSPVAESLANAGSGIIGNTVYLYDLEDHNWTYYQSDSPISSPNPRNVKITYEGNGGAVGIDAPNQVNFVYYKTLESEGNNYPYTTIANPFSKRPSEGSGNSKTYKGFKAWRVKSITGGSITNYAVNSEIPAETDINFVFSGTYSTNCISAEIILEAVWTTAYVVRCSVGDINNNLNNATLQGSSYETNFIVVNSGNSSSTAINANTQKSVTITMVEPDGSEDYRNSSRYINPQTITLNNALKFEYINMNNNNTTINANAMNLVLGRGIANTTSGSVCANYIRGIGGNKTSSLNYQLRIESGIYNYLSFVAGRSGGGNNQGTTHSCSGTSNLVKGILGCDYDRSTTTNSLLKVQQEIIMGYYPTFAKGNENRETLRVIARSGDFTSAQNNDIADADESFYLSLGGDQTYVGRRTLIIEGGQFLSIAGGIDEENPSDALSVYIRMKGGIVRGAIYGSGAFAATSGHRKIVVTGGIVRGWIAAGCNGTSTNQSGGILPSDTYVYVGGNATVGYKDGTTIKINTSEGGNVFGAGSGNSSQAETGRVNNSTVVIADDAYIQKNVYGGGNYGYTQSTSNVLVAGGVINGSVFGGSNQKQGATINLTTTGGQVLGGLYGGSNIKGTISNNVTMQINGGQVGTSSQTANIHGGGYGKDTKVNGDVTLTLGANTTDPGVTVYGDVYGGSALGTVNDASSDKTEVTLNCGTINGSLYGGGLGDATEAANVYGAVTVTVNGGSVKKTSVEGSGGVYGANNIKGAPQSSVTVDIYGTDTAPAEGEYALYAVYGGGNQADYLYGNGYPTVTVHGCDNSIEYIYGGGNAAAVAATDVTIWGGNVIGNVFGGGNGESGTAADVNGNVDLKICGGTIRNVFGGSNSLGEIEGDVNVNVNSQGEGEKTPCPMIIGNVYGGGNEADGNAGTITIGCTGALVEGDEGHLAHPENIGKTLEGIGAVYGGANNANIGNDVTLNINSGMVAKVFGGNNTGGTVNGNVTVNVNKSANTCGWYVGKVHGGGYGKETNVAENVTVNIENGTIYGDVYGGSALGKVNTNTENTTTVNLKGGIIKGDAYGGGLGDSTTEADVNGNVTVTLNGTAFELTTTTDDKGNSIPTSGRIFGCNNINGSPKGTVLVKVLNTVARDDEGNVKAKPTPNSGVYELQAVYGGGNLAAYNPTDPAADGQFTSYTYGGNATPHDNKAKPVQVVIDGCDETSIEYVYGGGNAAATPATDVTILGSYEIGSVFGGGNGKDRYTLDGGTTWNENKGADVGIINAEAYATDKSQGKYGTGNAMTSVLGGTVHNIYGGSNMKGNIVGNAVAYLDTASDCELNAGDIYGGGNEAYMDGGSGIQLGCIKYLKEIYGGARNADVGGDINLTITSGHFDRIFGGNNLGGAIKGSITVNIEETGCNPITIGELYGCGNKAAYTTPKGKQDPTLNIRSFTSIGNVYGGGLGEEAVVTGNPTVNINVVKGVNNAVEDWLYNDGRTIDFGDDYKVTLPVHEEGKIGAIGTVFGGGNAAKVIGNTNVNIGTETSVVFESLKGDERTKTVEGADIRGNVYGGGNKADVTGKTNVKVGRN
ncbi:MAG: chitobiase/beta-hexosaminidase C-terminal domain-containing protein [Bacteroidaceae bacterium]|nr:chitobiase/beta-hexosaminidase C-terminal domain-containing protein [Bacteroidaceae bacterium]